MTYSASVDLRMTHRDWKQLPVKQHVVFTNWEAIASQRPTDWLCPGATQKRSQGPLIKALQGTLRRSTLGKVHVVSHTLEPKVALVWKGVTILTLLTVASMRGQPG